MADETTTTADNSQITKPADAGKTDQPLARLSQAETEIGEKPQGDLHPESHSQSVTTEAGSTPAGERLRDFETEMFGPDVVRINGEIERGYGSPFQRMSEPKQRKHAALVRLVNSERKIDETNAAVSAAQAEHDEIEAEIAREDEAIAAEEDDARPE